jgi:hypothetical protein
MGHGRDEHKILVRKSEWKRPHERHRHRWEENIKIDLKDTGCEDVEWI